MEGPINWQNVAYVLGGVILSLCGVIGKMVHWFIFKERKNLADTFKAKEEKLENLSDKYNSAAKETQRIMGRVAARLTDIYQERRAVIQSTQKLIDLIARGKVAVAVEQELKEIQEEENMSTTRIMNNNKDK